MEISFSLFILTPTLPNLPSSYIDMIMTLCRMQCNLEKNNKCHKRKVKDGYSPLALAILDGDRTFMTIFVSLSFDLFVFFVFVFVFVKKKENEKKGKTSYLNDDGYSQLALAILKKKMSKIKIKPEPLLLFLCR